VVVGNQPDDTPEDATMQTLTIAGKEIQILGRFQHEGTALDLPTGSRLGRWCWATTRSTGW
jgi:hypothetical protein